MAGPEDIIAQIAAQKLGPAPGAAPAGDPAAAAAPAPAAPPAPPKADPSPTDMEKAQAKVSPTDQAAKDAADITFVKVGDREYTPQQLDGMMRRYKDLNYQWASNKPVVDVVTGMMEAAKKSGYEAKPEEVAALVDAAVKAYVKNPQFGQQQKQGESKGQAKPAMGDNDDEAGGDNFGDPDALYEQWEKENAVKLPPGFKEIANSSKTTAQKLDQMMQLFQKVIEGGLAGQTATQQAGQQVQQAQTMQADAATKMIANNLNAAFQKAGIPADPESRAQFRVFAAQRGYDFPDFMNPQLTATVVADYQANRNAPEMARLMEVAKRRQAFTGMADSTPGAGAAAPSAGDPMLANLVSSAMGKRGF